MKLCGASMALAVLISASCSVGAMEVEVSPKVASMWLDEIIQFVDIGPVSSPHVAEIRDAMRQALQMEDPVLKNVWLKLVHLGALGTRQVAAEGLFWSVEPPQNSVDIASIPGVELRSARRRWSNVENSLAREVEVISNILNYHLEMLSKQTGQDERLGRYAHLVEFVEALRSYIASRRHLPQLSYRIAYLRGLVSGGEKSLELSLKQANDSYMKAVDTVDAKMAAVLGAATRCLSNSLLPQAVVSHLRSPF